MQRIHIVGIVLIAVSVALVAQGCACHGKRRCAGRPEITEAIAVIQPTAGNQVTGVIRFAQRHGKVRVLADIKGLKPNAKHGFHIHEFGDFSLPSANSAGGHYNPEGRKHGGPPDPDRHAGDLGNLDANAAGEAHLDIVVENISLGKARNSIIGRGVVVHAGTDDLTTQPTGNAGARAGFGIIGIASPPK